MDGLKTTAGDQFSLQQRRYRKIRHELLP